MIKLNDYIPINSNFTYNEFVKSDTALRYCIDNTPNEKQWSNIKALVGNILQPLRYEFGPIRITSGFRSIELCRKIGSTAHSNHAKGEAADIEPLDPNVNLIDIMEWIDLNCDYRELIAEYFPNGWVHVAYRENGNDRAIKLKDKNHNYSRVSMKDIKEIYKK